MKYKGDNQHLLEHEDGHIRIDCWCKPELAHVEENHYLLHKDKDGKTIITDPKLTN